MAKKCPLTGEPVLYTECLECEHRGGCPPSACVRPQFALLVVGSREITDYWFVRRTIDRFIAPIRNKYRFQIVSGGARGVDSLAERYAHENGMDLHVIRAQWEKYGKAAGPIRNEEMHKYISSFEHRGCIIVWNGKSPGTRYNIPLAKQYDNPFRLVVFGKEDK